MTVTSGTFTYTTTGKHKLDVVANNASYTLQEIGYSGDPSLTYPVNGGTLSTNPSSAPSASVVLQVGADAPTCSINLSGASHSGNIYTGTYHGAVTASNGGGITPQSGLAALD